jgi:RNA polymerase sigma-70 factor, ECF subfamily
MPSISDLVTSARAGNDEALEQLIGVYQHRIGAMVIALVGDDDEWQDVCQMIFVKMAMRLPQLKDIDAFEPWLFSITRHSSFDHLRRRRRRAIFMPWQRIHDSIATEVPQEASHSKVVLDSAIEKLPLPQRELITMIRKHDWTYVRLARVTGESVAALKSRMSRARKRLRQLMAEQSK